MIPQLMLVTLLIFTCGGTLISPMNSGILGKASLPFLQDFAEKIIDKTKTWMMERTYDGSHSEGDWTIKSWGLRVHSISLEPTITLRNEGSAGSGTERLVVTGSFSGSLRASGSWSYETSSFFLPIRLSGEVDISDSGFSISNSFSMGKKPSGRVGFLHDPRDCAIRSGSLDVKITGSWYSWLLDIAVMVFEDDVKVQLQNFGCIEMNNHLGELTGNLEEAMIHRDFLMPLKTGGELEVDFFPTIITGGSSCMVMKTPASIQLTGLPKRPKEVVTPPFINIPVTETRVRIQTRDWCSAVPGPSTGISAVLTEDLVERFFRKLYHFDLLKFELEQTGRDSNTITFDVSRNGRRVKTIQIDLQESDGRSLADFELRRMKITSTAPPEVRITESGISLNVNLRVRVPLFSESPKIEIKTEFESLTEWRGTATLREKDGTYSLIPHVTASAEVWTGKLDLGSQKGGERRSGQREMEEGNQILESIERLLNSILEEKLTQVLEEDLRSGIPLNIPREYITLREVDISYREDYVLISVENVDIHLE